MTSKTINVAVSLIVQVVVFLILTVAITKLNQWGVITLDRLELSGVALGLAVYLMGVLTGIPIVHFAYKVDELRCQRIHKSMNK